MRTSNRLSLAVLLCSVAANASAQQVGDKIVVKTDEALLRSKEATTGKVPKGEILVVREAKGDRLWVTYSSGHGTASGWIDRSAVIPFSQAPDFFDAELKRSPTARAYAIRGKLWTEKEEFDKALSDLNEAIRLDPKRAEFWVRRSSVWLAEKEYDKVLADANEALRLDPKNAWAYDNRGCAWYEKRELVKASADFNEAIRIDPNDALTHSNRAAVWLYGKDFDAGISEVSEAIRLEPTNPRFYVNRGLLWRQKGEYGKAIADCDEASRLDPKFAPAWNERAWLAVICGDPKYRDGKQAVRDATKACELTAWKNERCLVTLAAAYAETGDFPNAIKWQEKALEIAPEKLKERFRQLLERYKAEKPYSDKLTK
jgi:tetratricopeptide (TPR) repeat protein